MDFLKELNEAQIKAASHVEGPMMVIAGAGSGKTRVLTYRIAHLIEQGIDPFNVLALTFTNKAAREMKSRIAQLVGDTDAQNIWMGTFHSIFARILRIESDRIGYPRNFSIYDTQDSRSLIKTVIKEMNLDDKVYKPNLVHGRISSAKNNLISPGAYMKNTDIVAEDRSSGKPRLGEIYQEYDKRLFKAGAMDFDDLLFKTNVLLKEHPDILHKYQHKFHFILVDEYQDTNFAQYLIVKQLAALNENICVVGDDAQSIYAFRGANIQNILNFRQDYPDFVLYKLEQNYRSTSTIVEAANSVIAKNKEQIKKKVWTENITGEKIKIIKTLTDNEEGRQIAQSIFEIKNNDKAANHEFAILYRTNAQSRSFEEALRKLNIPYKIYGGLSFYQRKEIKDLIAYFRLTANPNDEESFKRIVNYPKRGIGKTTVESLAVAANENSVTLWEVAEDPMKYKAEINSRAVAQLQKFITTIKSFRAQLETAPVYEIGHSIAASSGLLKDLYSDKTPEGVSRYENVEELLNGMKEFQEGAPDGETRYLSDFLVDVALLTDADNEDPDDFDKVSMMTIHAAKGLEFPYVFIVGMEENLFPSQMSLNSRSELEEERRLFYVALTRAEKRATLSYATSRYRWGNLTHAEPSRFLEEIDEQFVDPPEEPTDFFGSDTDFGDQRGWGSSSFAGTKQKSSPKKTSTGKKKSAPAPPPTKKNLVKMSSAARTGGQSADNENIQEGTSVKHARFGKGKVLNLEGNPPNVKATVYFPSVGQKQLLLKFAKLEVID